MKKICAIDDDSTFHFILRENLSLNGIATEILEFNDGEEAIQFWERNLITQQDLPDFIFLDVNMPIMDGWQFLDAFQLIAPKLNKEVPIYMISSSINESDLVKVQSYGSLVKQYILKPVSSDLLQEILR